MRNRKTTKLLALALSLLMLFTMIPISVSAGDEPQTILDVAQHDENGNYWLEADVTVNATYAGEFTGTFDGKGFTVNTTAPLFKTVNGATIENLTVQGTVAGYAAVASLVTGDNKTTFKNITNKASVTNSAAVSAGDFDLSVAYVTAAGLASFVYSTSADFINCTNTGAITGALADGASTGTTTPAGAMIGYASGSTVNIEDCKNTGAISANKMAAGMIAMLNNTNVSIVYSTNSGAITSATTYAGGIVAYKQNSGDVSIKNCTNSNTVTGTGYVGGIVGYAKGASPLTVVSCGNTKNVTATEQVASSGSYVAGIIGFSDQTISALTVKYCYNTGNITSAPGKCAAGIVGRMNYLSTSTGGVQSIVDGCYNSGTITGTDGHYAQIFWATTAANKRIIGTNFYLSDSLTAYVANGTKYNTIDENDKSEAFTTTELASGELAKTMNDAISKTLKKNVTIYYQNINKNGATPDDHPVTDPTRGYVFEHTDGKLYSIAFYTLQSASVRISELENERGMRFSTAVNKEDYAVLTAEGVTLSFGTLITPDAYLEVAGYDFTKEGLEKLNTSNPYLDVYTTATGTNVFRKLRGNTDTDNYYFCGSITGIGQDNYEWDYSAIGYVTINGNIVYSGQYATRNIAYVANAAVNDTAAGYTDTELEIIRGYLLQD